MNVSPRLRVRFHAAGPDGRQTMPVDVDVALFTRCVGVQRVDVGQAVWTFNAIVLSDDVAEPALTINGVGAIATTAAGDFAVLATYADDFIVADPWAIAVEPVHVVGDSLAIIVPQSGLVIA